MVARARETGLGDLFVVERHHVAQSTESCQRLGVVRVADDDVGHDPRSTVVGSRGQHGEPDTQRDRRLLCHAGQLAAANHAHDGIPARRSHYSRVLSHTMNPMGQGRTVPTQSWVR